MARDELPRDQWDFYALEIVPYLSHFDAAVGGARQDGDLDRMSQVITVK
jgi:hypothetical protein